MSWPYALVTDAGLMRQNNEDSARVVPELGLFIIADGMGGHIAGEVASQVASDTLATTVANHAPPRRIRDQCGVMEQAIHAANDAVLREGLERKLLGMGTTLTALRITSRTATICHIGDTRAYFVREKRLAPITTDHTMVEMLRATGVVSEEEAENHPDKHLLTQAIGTHMMIEPDVFQKRIPRDCRILLSTDGLHDHVSSEVVHQTALLPDLDEAGRALIEAANSAGGPDNITVVLIGQEETS